MAPASWPEYTLSRRPDIAATRYMARTCISFLPAACIRLLHLTRNTFNLLFFFPLVAESPSFHSSSLQLRLPERDTCLYAYQYNLEVPVGKPSTPSPACLVSNLPQSSFYKYSISYLHIAVAFLFCLLLYSPSPLISVISTTIIIA